MRLYQLLFLTISCLLSINFAQAQERVKNRAEQRANQRVDREVDQAVDKAANAIEGLFRRKKKNRDTEVNPNTTHGSSDTTEPSSNETDASGILSRIRMGGDFEPYQNPIIMNLSADITTIDKRGKEQKATVHYTFDTWATGMRLVSEDNTARILLDNQEGYMTVIGEDDGETQGMRMRQPAVDYDELLPDESSYTITELTNIRTIEGYTCKEYLIEHEQGTTNAWITQDLEVDPEIIMKAMASQMQGNKKNNNHPVFDLPGIPMESTTVSADGKETVIAKYYDLKFGDNVDKSVFNTDGINIISMGF